MSSHPPPMAAVALVLRDAAPAKLAPLASLITEFADVPLSVTLARAAASGSTRLFDRVASRGRNHDPQLRAFGFARAMQAAIQRDDLQMIQHVHRYHAGPLVVVDTVSETSVSYLGLAFQYGTLETIQWLVENRHDVHCGMGGGLPAVCKGCLLSALRAIGPQDVDRVVTWLLEIGVLSSKSPRTGRHWRRALELSADLLRWAHERDLISAEVARQLLEDAVHHNKPAAASFLYENGYRLDPSTVKSSLIRVATAGYDDIVDLMIAWGECDALVGQFQYAAVRPGGPKILQWCDDPSHERGGVHCSTAEFVQVAAYISANVDTLEWLRTECQMTALYTFPWHKIPDEGAVLRLYEWMKRMALIDQLTEYNVTVAAASGYLEVIQWLHVNVPNGWTTAAMNAAAQHGHLHVVKWLHANRREGCTARAMDIAASSGDLKLVQWLHKHRTEGDIESAMFHAARGGHLDVLVWLRHCSETSKATCTTCLTRAALSSVRRPCGASPNLHLLQWLQINPTLPCKRCAPRDVDACIADALACILDRDLDAAKFLYAQLRSKDAFEIDRQALLRIVRAGHVPILQWVVDLVPKRDLSSPTDPNDDWRSVWQEAIVEALHYGRDHVVAWIQSIDTDG